MSFANGKSTSHTKIRGVTRAEVNHGSRGQTRESTFISEDITESNQTSTTVVKAQRTNSNREPMLNRVLAAKRVAKSSLKKHCATTVVSSVPETVVKHNPDRKPAARSREEPSTSSASQTIQSHMVRGNRGFTGQYDQKTLNSSRTRELKSDSPLKFRMQNGWIRPSPSPLAVRMDGPFGHLGRRAHGLRDSANPNTAESGLTVKSTKTNPVPQLIDITSLNAKTCHHVDRVTGTNEALDPPRREYTADRAVSAWLLQCNNASVMLDETDSVNDGNNAGNGVTAKPVVEEDSGILVPDMSEFETRPQGALQEEDSFTQTTQLRAFFMAPVPNKLAQSGQFIRSPTYVDLRHPTDGGDEADSRILSGVLASTTSTKLDAPNEGETLQGHEFNSVNAQDWTSVSSSEWGDEMCEFDRQQSQRVREMFEEIDRMLFDSPVRETSKPKHRLPTHSTFDDSREPAGADFDVSHLKGECEDWLSRFPHLRVVGTQIVPTRDAGYEFHSSAELNSRVSKAFSSMNLNTKHDDASPIRLVGSSSAPSLPQVNANDESHTSTTLRFSSSNADEFTLSPRTNTGLQSDEYSTTGPCRFALYGSGEEILAIDGEYEEVIVIDREPDVDSSLTPRRKRRDRKVSRHDSPNAGANRCQDQLNVKQSSPDCVSSKAAAEYLSSQTITSRTVGMERSGNTNSLEKSFVDLLVEEINSDLLSWLRAVTQAESGPTSDVTGTRDTNLTRLSTVKADAHAQATRHTGHGTRAPNDESNTGSATGTTVDPDGCVTNLAGLLQISTKALQQRERTLTHEPLDSTNRTNMTDQINSISGSTTLPSSQWLSRPNRDSSPPPIYCCPVTPMSNRPLSGVHVKAVPNSSRKTHTATDSVGAGTVTTCSSGSTGPNVIGVAASFHPVGRLAPLDRVRTPCGLLTSSQISDEFVSPVQEAGSHTAYRNKNPFNSGAHGTPQFQASSVQVHASTPNQTTQSQTNSMMLHSPAIEHLSGRGGCTLPPLGTGVVTSTVGLGPLGQPNTNVPALPAASRPAPGNTRLGTAIQATNQLQQNASAQYQLQQQQQPQHSVQPHAPTLRGTSANLVTQQINNSGLLLPGQGQKVWTRSGPRSTRTNQTVAPCLRRRANKTWRPQTSISTDLENKSLGLPHIFDRSASTLLVRRIGDPFSECNSPRKLPSTTSGSRPDRVGAKFGGIR